MKLNGNIKDRFQVKLFSTERGTVTYTSWQVCGTNRLGNRIRENFKDQNAAKARKLALEAEYLATTDETQLKATTLSDKQLEIARKAFLTVNEDLVLQALEFWQKHGSPVASNVPFLDDAKVEFVAWCKKELAEGRMRQRTFDGKKNNLDILSDYLGNPHLDQITETTVKDFVAKRKAEGKSEPTIKKNVEGLSSLMQFAKERKWIKINVARENQVILPDVEKEIHILAMADVEAYLRKAESFENGKWLPFVVLALIAGIRPTEIYRMESVGGWKLVNMVDGEIVLPGSITKTGVKRIIRFNDAPEKQGAFNSCLRAWLEVCHGKPIFPGIAADYRKFRSTVVGITKHIHDVLRHTAISAFFRLVGEYGRTAEQFGNSEGIIKEHYQGKISSTETATFYSHRPTVNAGH